MSASSWYRTINSAQRKVQVPARYAPALLGLRELTFDIQGIQFEYEARSEKILFCDIHEQAVRAGLTPAMRIWDRLRRRPAKIGKVQEVGDGKISLLLWARKPIELLFDLGNLEDQRLFRECEIMALSSGHHFENLDPERFYQS